MKHLIAALLVLFAAGCATGTHHRTTVTENSNGSKTVQHEVKQTGLWFTSGKPQAIAPTESDALPPSSSPSAPK